MGIMVRTLMLVALATMAVAASACGSSEQSSRTAIVDVVTTGNIAEDWVRQVGGDRVEVFSLVPPGADPHTFQPGARDVTRVADADVVFSMGLGLEEGWLEDLLDTASSNAGVVMVLGDVVDPIIAEGQEAAHHDVSTQDRARDPHQHRHPKGADHEEAGIVDPHFWFDPLRVKLVIAEIALTLTALDPAGAQEYRDNSITYLQELDTFHAWATGMLTTVPTDRRVLVTSHDVLGYFALRYGFKVIGTLMPGVTTAGLPSARDLTNLVDVVTEQGVPAIFVENTTSDRLAIRVAEEAGVAIVRSLYTDSLSKEDDGADTYLGMMRTNVATIVEALQ